MQTLGLVEQDCSDTSDSEDSENSMEDIELGAVTEHNIKLPNSSKSSNTPLIQTVQSDNKQKTLINEVNMCDTERDSEKGLDT